MCTGLISRQITNPSRSSLLTSTASTVRPLSFLLVAQPQPPALAMVKRKRLSTATESPAVTTVPIPPPRPDLIETAPPPLKRRASSRRSSQPATGSTNPDQNANVLDAPSALRASPDADENDERMDLEQAGMDTENQLKQGEEPPAQKPTANGKAATKKGAAKGKGAKAAKTETDSAETEIAAPEPKTKKKGANVKAVKTEVNGATEAAGTKSKKKVAGVKAEPEPADATPKKEAVNVKKDPQFLDPEAEGDEEADEEEIQAALSRPPPVNSDYLPLPWKGRLGYACLCTYLRFSNPPVFSSRTCRIASILENRHPLTDPNAPPHATKNRPDREKPASVARGQAFVQSLGKANAKDIVKMLRWNDRYGIKFMRLSSEMFPFASHPEYGYKLAPFVSEELAEAGRVAAELGHRLTTHPGQYTQLGSPRKPVIDNAIRDLDYHAELLDLLKLPPQQDRDAVMILHLGGVFGDKEATLNRFRENYAPLAANVKKRLVLENDDVSWSVHELLPLCEELNIPMVLDFHHHNIIFDASQIREGTADIVDLFPRILATWTRKGITPKMHYSEPTPAAITGRQRRKHNPRVATLPPCPPDMDLMIEAKDKEQAVFELMRTFKLPGFDAFNDMIPHVRKDDNKPAPKPKKSPAKKQKSKAAIKDEDDDAATDNGSVAPDPMDETILDDDVGMGGPEGRVYWPPGMEHWLRPVKRVIKPKGEPKAEAKEAPKPKSEAAATDDAETKKLTPAQKKKNAAAEAAREGAKVEEEVNGIKQEEANGAGGAGVNGTPTPTPASKKTKAAKAKPPAETNGTPTPAKKSGNKRVVKKKEDTPELTDEAEEDVDDVDDVEMSDFEAEEEEAMPTPVAKRGKKANGNGVATKAAAAAGSRRQSGGRGAKKNISYADESGEDDV